MTTFLKNRIRLASARAKASMYGKEEGEFILAAVALYWTRAEDTGRNDWTIDLNIGDTTISHEGNK